MTFLYYKLSVNDLFALLVVCEWPFCTMSHLWMTFLQRTIVPPSILYRVTRDIAIHFCQFLHVCSFNSVLCLSYSFTNLILYLCTNDYWLEHIESMYGWLMNRHTQIESVINEMKNNKWKTQYLEYDCAFKTYSRYSVCIVASALHLARIWDLVWNLAWKQQLCLFRILCCVVFIKKRSSLLEGPLFTFIDIRNVLYVGDNTTSYRHR